LTVASHDTASAVSAVPAEGKNWAFISSGTWSIMGMTREAPLIDSRTLKGNFTNEGGLGGTYRLSKNITGLWLLQRCRREWQGIDKSDYPTLLAAADKIPAFHFLINPDAAEFLNPDSMTEAIKKFCRRTSQPLPATCGEFTRCILDSLALKYRFVLDELRALQSQRIHSIHIIGGGVKNRLLCQFTADATGLPVKAGPVEATSIGNLMVQALALGAVESPAMMKEIIKNSVRVQTYEPDPGPEWKEAYDRFKSILMKSGR
jgi:rhamnulokinase